MIQTQAINALRAHLSELGLVAAGGMAKVVALIEIVRDDSDNRLPKAARFALSELATQIEALTRQIAKIEREIVAEAKRDEDMRRLTTIPGVGVITAASVKAFVPDPAGFVSGRHFAAWLGLTPKPHSSGGKERQVGISKMGNAMLRSLLVLGASAVLRHSKNKADGPQWITALLARRPFKIVAVALANNMARILWALLTHGGVYRKAHPDEGLARIGWRRAKGCPAQAGLKARRKKRDEAAGRKPDANEAVPAMRSQRAGLIKPIASRTSSRPAVNDRAEQAGHMTAPLPERSPSKKPLAIGAVPHMPEAPTSK